MSLSKNIGGDKVIWALVVILGAISLWAVYSASTNLVYVVGNGSTSGHLFKHMVFFIIGLFVIWGVHRIPYMIFGVLSTVMMVGIWVLLGYTLMIGGENTASRWVTLPIGGIGIQPSALAFLVVMIYTAKYLSQFRDRLDDFKLSLFRLWLPVGIVIALIFKEDLSTAMIIVGTVSVLVLVGKYPLKHYLKVFVAGLVMFGLFLLVIKAYPNLTKNRVDTWESRILGKNTHQIEKAKMAIATGRISGLGFGKSVQRNFLSQSSSDFIFAIIIEESGLVGAIIIIGLYFWLFLRIVIVAYKAKTLFSKLLVIGLSLPIIFQTLINMLVAVGVGIVTGQPLPLISSGGTSVIATCLSIGIILNVSKNSQEEKPIEPINDEDEMLGMEEREN